MLGGVPYAQYMREYKAARVRARRCLGCNRRLGKCKFQNCDRCREIDRLRRRGDLESLRTVIIWGDVR